MMNLLEELHSLHQEFLSLQPTKLSKCNNILSLYLKIEDSSARAAGKDQEYSLRLGLKFLLNPMTPKEP